MGQASVSHHLISGQHVFPYWLCILLKIQAIEALDERFTLLQHETRIGVAKRIMNVERLCNTHAGWKMRLGGVLRGSVSHSSAPSSDVGALGLEVSLSGLSQSLSSVRSAMACSRRVFLLYYSWRQRFVHSLFP